MAPHDPIEGASPGCFAFFSRLWDGATTAQKTQFLVPREAALLGSALAQPVEDTRARLAYDHALRVVLPTMCNVAGFATFADALEALPFMGGAERRFTLITGAQVVLPAFRTAFPSAYQGANAQQRRRRAVIYIVCSEAWARSISLRIGAQSCIDAVRMGSETVKTEAGGNFDESGNLQREWGRFVSMLRAVGMLALRAVLGETLTASDVNTIDADPQGAAARAVIVSAVNGINTSPLASQALTVLDNMLATIEV